MLASVGNDGEDDKAIRQVGLPNEVKYVLRQSQGDTMQVKTVSR